MNDEVASISFNLNLCKKKPTLNVTIVIRKVILLMDKLKIEHVGFTNILYKPVHSKKLH
jgi:hypothetical protein